MGGSHTDSGGRAAAMASHNGHATHGIGDEIRAERACKIVNSGSPQRFQPQPSLRSGALRWMQAKLLEMCPPGLTALKRLWFSRSHVAAHSHPRIHRARRHRRGVDPFASCPRTYYPTNRCGTDRRVSKTARYPSKPAPDQVRVFSFQNPLISLLPSELPSTMTRQPTSSQPMPTAPTAGAFACGRGQAGATPSPDGPTRR